MVCASDGHWEGGHGGYWWDTCHPGDLNRTHPVLAARGNKAPLIGREETGARCSRERGGCVNSAQGQMRLPRESSACCCSAAAASPARPRGRHSFLHLVGELLRGYRLGEDRGSTGGGGWRINLHSEGESRRQDARNTHAGADLAS